MSEEIEFGSKAAADAAREEYEEHLCSDDDRRLTRVTFSSTTPDDVFDRVRREAEDVRSEQVSGPGQIPLTDHEQGVIDFSRGRANIPHARAVKGIARSEGVDDWTAHYDPLLTVDEHREVMSRAGQQGGGRRREDTETPSEKAGRASRVAQSEECDHARGHCKNGDPEACEFLQTRCGLDDETVQSLLSEHESDDRGDDIDDQGGDSPLTGVERGTLKRSWQGYQGAVQDLPEAIEQVEEAWTHAQQAARAINGVREGVEDTPVGVSDETADAADQVIETDDQRTLTGEQADDQTRLAGGERGETVTEIEETTEENPGGLLADERDEIKDESTTEQQKPDEFQVAEGGQETL